MNLAGQLVCWEAWPVPRANPDPVLLESRVLAELLAAEERYLPSPSYFQRVQKEVRPPMRRVLANWMLEVCEEENCEEDVFPLAMNCLDRFLSLLSVEKRQLQLLGSTCLLLASKMKETSPITMEKLCLYSDYSSTEPELKAMELLVLNKLKWDIAAVTPRDFLPHFLEPLCLAGAKKQLVQKHTETFIALCANDCNFIAFPPSMIAAASVAASVAGLRVGNLDDPTFHLVITEHLASAIRCDLDVLRACQEQLENSLQSTIRQAQRSQEPLAKSVEEVERSSTPTDVLDIDL
ncbi:G1/S-specific cyclin-D1-like [Lissotriton helveticus]